MPIDSFSGIKTLENQSPSADTPGCEDKDKQGNPYQIVLEPFLCGSLHGVRWNQDLEQFGIGVQSLPDRIHQGGRLVRPHGHHEDVIPCKINIGARKQSGNITLLVAMHDKLHHECVATHRLRDCTENQHTHW